MKKDGDERRKLGGWGIGGHEESGLERFVEEVEERNKKKFEFFLDASRIFFIAENKETEDDQEQIAARDIQGGENRGSFGSRALIFFDFIMRIEFLLRNQKGQGINWEQVPVKGYVQGRRSGISDRKKLARGRG